MMIVFMRLYKLQKVGETSISALNWTNIYFCSFFSRMPCQAGLNPGDRGETVAWLRDGVPISLEGQRRIRVATADNILQIQGNLVFTL